MQNANPTKFFKVVENREGPNKTDLVKLKNGSKVESHVCQPKR
jgi:hypothetical protein